MKAILGTKVSINHKSNNQGKIVIDYYSNDELERILYFFQSKQSESEKGDIREKMNSGYIEFTWN